MVSDAMHTNYVDSPVVASAYEECGVYVATVDAAAVLRLWKASPGGEVRIEHQFSTGHSCLPTAVAFAPTRLGLLLATAAEDGLAIMHRPNRRNDSVNPPMVLRDALASLRSLAWASDASLATLGDDSTVRVYRRCSNGRWLLEAGLRVNGSPRALCFAPTGILLAGSNAFKRSFSCGVWKDTHFPGTPGGTDWTCTHWGNGADMLAIGMENGVVKVGTGVKMEVLAVTGKMSDGESGEKGAAAVDDVKWDPSGSTLAVVHRDGWVRTWKRTPKTQKLEDAETDGAWDWEMNRSIEPGK